MKSFLVAGMAVCLGFVAIKSDAIVITSGATLSGLSEVASNTASYSDTVGSLDLAGTLTSMVYTGNNADTLGGDTFVFSLAESGSANDIVDALSLTGFGGTTFSVGYINPTGSLISPAGNYTVSGPQQVITFQFNQNITAGELFSQIVVYDSSPTFAPNLAAVMDSISGNTVDLAPIDPVPEPTTLALLGTGVAALIFRFRKNKSL